MKNRTSLSTYLLVHHVTFLRGLLFGLFLITVVSLRSAHLSTLTESAAQQLVLSTDIECNWFPALDRWFRDEGLAAVPNGYFADQKPFGVPLLPDLNGDFKVEYFFNEHEIPGEGYPTSTYKRDRFATYIGATNATFLDIPIDITRTDLNEDSSEIPSNHWVMDCHGGAIVDLDRDGYLDILQIVGANVGVGLGLRYSNLLFWGRPTDDAVSYSRFEGGVRAAVDAGLTNDGGLGRGRGLRIADFNDDGLLDVVMFNEKRADDIVSPSRLYYNNGNRTFSMDPTSFGYSRMMIWMGRDLHVQYQNLTWVRYRHDPSLKRMVAQKTGPFDESSTHFTNSAQVLFIDDDDEPDFFLSSTDVMQFHYSMGGLETIKTPDGYGRAMAHVDDYNLDGRLDMIMVSKKNTTYRMDMYTRDETRMGPPYWKLVVSKDDFPKNIPFIGWVDPRWGHPDLYWVIDMAAGDYSNDGLPDVMFASGVLQHLTNTFSQAQKQASVCSSPRFFTVVLRGSGYGNDYGIGATVSLKVSHKGGNTTTMRRFVSTYSHGNSQMGGLTDHRLVFGMGATGIPSRVTVQWQNGEVTSVEEEGVLALHLNDITNPLVVSQADSSA